ncbi:cysteine desulfurase family protein [uncultured Senegalimassilia sp.]|uniref:cysteine desulfurase family protein n=1 Tax=uncultured Senegalimassilia sp. TaxID=1714350 RepID=UPI0026714387|nr:cysteine desulfurase family protein [uncultured Senegalimassilia sp.]
MVAKVPDNYVYLDYAATAPLIEEAAQAMAPYMQPGRANIAYGGNANSLHVPGRAAFAALEDARRRIARALGAQRPDELILTSGATEADNAALFGLANAAVAARRRAGAGDFTPHVVVSAIEHDAVLAPAKRLEQQGFRVTRVAPNRAGFITPEALAAVLDANTVLVSVMTANSELGSIQPVAELAKVAHAAGALFHTDATQALGKTPVDVCAWGCDAASFSAHKVGGPKGIGALYVKARTPFDAYLLGGGQEAGRRSGTQNVAGAAGFAAAVEAAQANQPAETQRLAALRDKLYAALAATPGVHPTVDVAPGSTEYLPNIVHVLVDALESETLILRFDMRGFGVSGGSACSSHSLEPSHVLRAVGIGDDAAHGALRISMGRYTTEADIDNFIAAVGPVLDWE